MVNVNGAKMWNIVQIFFSTIVEQFNEWMNKWKQILYENFWEETDVKMGEAVSSRSWQDYSEIVVFSGPVKYAAALLRFKIVYQIFFRYK